MQFSPAARKDKCIRKILFAKTLEGCSCGQGELDKLKFEIKKSPLWANKAEVCLASSKVLGKVPLKSRNRQGKVKSVQTCSLPQLRSIPCELRHLGPTLISSRGKKVNLLLLSVGLNIIPNVQHTWKLVETYREAGIWSCLLYTATNIAQDSLCA